MAIFNLKREVGLEGATAWIVKATEFADLLDLVYSAHFGEIWLYNNDLEVLLDKHLFPPIYVSRIARNLRTRIEAVKILVSDKCVGHVFPKDGGPSPTLLKRLKAIKENGGRMRLTTFYFGRASEARTMFPDLSSIPSEHTWVFYTHRGSVRPPNYGIVLVRPTEFPFYQSGGQTRYAIAWQMTEEVVLPPETVKAFMGAFHDERLFAYFDDSRDYGLVDGWSKATGALEAKRDKQPPPTDGLAFGENADIAIIASRPDELAHLKTLLRNVRCVPAPRDATYKHECATVQTAKMEARKLLLAVIGEGNLCAASVMWDILRRWEPTHVILCGVAGADPRCDKPLDIGDIVVAERTVEYERGRIIRSTDGEPWRFVPVRDSPLKPEGCLFQAACKLCDGWPLPGTRIPGRPKWVIGPPKARPGVVGSGSKVIEVPDYFPRMLHLADSKIDTVETEAAGACYACGNYPEKPRGLLVIRGIMDKVNFKTRKKREMGRKYACNTCGQFVFDLLRSL